MAFDITKSFTTPTLPKAEAPGLAEKAAALRARVKPEKGAGSSNSFADELTSEPARNAQTSKKPDTKTDARSAEPTRKQPASMEPRGGQTRDTESANPVNTRTPTAVNPPQDQKPDLTLNQSAADADGKASLTSPVREGAIDSTSPAFNQLFEQFASDNKDEILQSPVAALLAANLQTMNPEELSDLLGKNKFLSMALFGGESAAVLEQADKPAEMFDALGISKDLLQQFLSSDHSGDGTEDGADQRLSAAQIFSAVGLEPGFVANQLNALKQQLALPVPPEMTADQVFADAAEPSSLTAGKLDPSVKVFSGNRLSSKAFSAQGIDDTFSAGRDSEDGNGDVVGNSAAIIGMSQLAQAGGQLVDSGKAAAASENLAKPDETLSVVTGALGDQFDVFKQWKQTAADGLAGSGPEDIAKETSSTAGALGKTATFDAFFELGQKIDRLDPETVSNVDMSNVPKRAAETAVTPSFMEAVINRFGSAQLQKPSVNASSGVIQVPGVVTEAAVMGSDKDATSDVAEAPARLIKSIADGAPQAINSQNNVTTDIGTRKFTVDEFLGDVTAGRINFDFAKSDSDSFTGSDDGDSRKFPGEQILGAMRGGDSNNAIGAFGENFSAHMNEVPAKAEMTPAQRADLAQKVLDSSTYLIRRGEGSVRLDLSSPDIGPLEIAVSMADNKVDIKVFTESDPVRDAMIADLSRLKEALQNQNVNLNHVQVGVGQRFGGSGAFDQGSQFNQQFNQQRDMREAFAQSLSNASGRSGPEASLRDLSIPAIGRMNQISADGRIQIRI